MFNQEQFGKKLAELRKGKGYSREKFAEIIGISREHLGRLERGEKGPSIDIIISISNVFNVSTDFLLLDKDRSDEQKQALKEKMNEMLAMIENL